MGRSRACPVCGGATPAGRGWQSFWTGQTACVGCGAALQLGRGWAGRLAHNALHLAGAAPAYLAARGLPGAWGVVVVLVIFLPLDTVLIAAAQWLRWRYAELAPWPGRPPGDGTT